MKPPSGGPITGPISAGTVRYAIAETSSDFGIVRSTTSRPTGTIIAPPIPWRIRAITSCGSVSTSEQPIEPSVKTTIAEQNTVRAPNRSASQPESGMKMAEAAADRPRSRG